MQDVILHAMDSEACKKTRIHSQYTDNVPASCIIIQAAFFPSGQLITTSLCWSSYFGSPNDTAHICSWTLSCLAPTTVDRYLPPAVAHAGTDRQTLYRCVEPALHTTWAVSVMKHDTVAGGHYTTYALNYVNLTWYEYDDQIVTEVDAQQVENCEAYVLFYRFGILPLSI